jgi:T-complex protein 1 subunit zeta
LIDSERNFTDAKVMKIIELKKKLCDGTDKNFVVINQKGIDPPALELLAKEKIIGIRRAKRRNLERLPLACGGKALNSVEDMTEDDLGFAKLVYEYNLGDDKYTFIEGVENPFSCTILIKGPNDYSIA